MKKRLNVFRIAVIILLVAIAVLSVATPTQGQSRSQNATLQVWNGVSYVNVTAFNLTWANSHEANSLSFINCNFDPACATDGALITNSFVETTSIVALTDHNPNLPCVNTCSVKLNHTEYPVNDLMYVSVSNQGTHWKIAFTKYP